MVLMDCSYLGGGVILMGELTPVIPFSKCLA